MSPPCKFTVITSTFNAAEDLAVTADSLAAQSHHDFEWIIIDGASSDGTVDLAKSFGQLVSRLISEPDSGIYNAWNKAIPFVTGDWVIFLGAGDSLFDATVLQNLCAEVARCDDSITTVYGNVSVYGKAVSEHVQAVEWKGIQGPWVAGRPVLPCHQGVVHRARLFHQGFRFDERCKIAADNEILLRELMAERSKKLDMVISRFNADGISFSRKRRLRMVAESLFINYKVGIFHRRPAYQLAVLASNVVKHPFRLLGNKTI